LKNLVTGGIFKHLRLEFDADSLVKFYDSGNLPCYDVAKLVHDRTYEVLRNRIMYSNPPVLLNGRYVPLREIIDYLAKAMGAATVIGISLHVNCTPEAANYIINVLKKAISLNGLRPEINLHYDNREGRWLLNFIEIFVDIPVSTATNMSLLDSYPNAFMLHVLGGKYRKTKVREMHLVKPYTQDISLIIYINNKQSPGNQGYLDAEIVYNNSHFSALVASPAYTSIAWPVANAKRNSFDIGGGAAPAEFYQNSDIVSL